MADNIAQTSAPTPSASPAPRASSSPAPSASPAPAPRRELDPNGVNTPSDIFADFSRQLGLDDDEQMNDLSKAKKYEERSIEDIYNSFDKEGEKTPDTQPEMQTNNEEENVVVEEPVEPEFKPYEFKSRLGEKEINHKFETQAELDKALRKAWVADELYPKYKELQAQMPKFQEAKAFAERFDKLVEEEPTTVLDSIIEEMGEDQLKEWLMRTAEQLSRDPKEREIERKLKEAETYKQQMEQMRREKEELDNRRKQAAEEADRHVTRAWGEGILSKVEARYPEHIEIFKRELRNSLIEGKHMQANGEQVTVKTLNSIFARNVKPIMDLLNSRSTSNTVQKEVGKAVEGKKQAGLARVQHATSSMNAKPQPKKPVDDGSDVGDVFNNLIKGVEQGRYRFRQ